MLSDHGSNALDLTEQCSGPYRACLYIPIEQCSSAYGAMLWRVRSSALAAIRRVFWSLCSKLIKNIFQKFIKSKRRHFERSSMKYSSNMTSDITFDIKT